MAIHIDSKERLNAIDSQCSLLEDDVSVGICDEESEDGAKCDSNTEDYMSAEEEDEHKRVESIDSGVSMLNKFQSDMSLSDRSSHSQEEFGFFKNPGREILSSDGALESAAMLAEGIKTLGKTQEENWKRMNDLISKKDNLIKEMTDLVTSFKQKMAPPDVCQKEKDKSKLKLCSSCKTPFQSTLIPERDTNELWSKSQVDFIEDLYHGSDNVSKCTAVDCNVLCECSVEKRLMDEKESLYITGTYDMPLLEVPHGYGDEEEGGKEVAEMCLQEGSPILSTLSDI